jgi:anti-anti-sigma factor
VVTVTGDVDHDTAPLIEQVLLQTIDHRPRTCLDLGQVDFFGAAGIDVLLSAYQRAAERGHSVVARGVHGMIERVLGIAGLDTLVVSAERSRALSPGGGA